MGLPVGFQMIATLLAALSVANFEAGAGTIGVLVEDHRVPLVDIRLQFPVGTASPWAAEQGAAEAFETAMADPDRALRRRADRLATRITLWMDPWSAQIQASCHKRDVPLVLQLMRDVLDNERLDRGELKRLRREAGLARQLEQQYATVLLAKRAAELLFDVKDARRRAWDPPAGSLVPQRLAQVRRELVRMPGRMAGFAGDVTAEEAAQWTALVLPPVAAAVPANTAPQFLPSATVLPARTEVRIRKLTQVFYWLGRESLPIDSPDYPALMVASEVLGGHFYSRLLVALRHESGDTYGASNRLPAGKETSLFALTTFTRAGNAVEVERKLREVLTRFHDDGVTAEELAESQGAISGERAFARQAPGQVLGGALWELSRGLPSGLRDELAAKAALLTVEQVDRFVKQWFDPARFGLLMAKAR